MLILARKAGQRILIGPDIVVEVNQIRGNQVRVGIVAPKNVTIIREELKDRPRESTEEQS